MRLDNFIVIAIILTFIFLPHYLEKRIYAKREKKKKNYTAKVPDEMVEAIADMANEDPEILNKVDMQAMKKYLDEGRLDQ